MLPYVKKNVTTYQRETVPFLGLNRSDDVREGEFSHQENMSDRRYPFLAPRLPRGEQTYTNPSALFAWDGKEIVVEGGQLLYDGQSLCSVTGGEKQFAVVNTKLVVWPDKIAVDLTNRAVTRMAASVSNKGSATFANNSITLNPRTLYATGYAGGYSSPTSRTGCPWSWTYSAVSWSETDGWVLEGAQLTPWRYAGLEGRIYIPRVSYSQATDTYSFQQHDPVVWQEETPDPSLYPEPEPGNDLGFYGVLTSAGWSVTESSAEGKYNADYYWAAKENSTDLTQVFTVGDYVSVTGAAEEGNDCGHLLVTGVTVTALTVEGSPFSAGEDTGAVTITRDMPALDFICESENRLWGVSNRDKTIYASALGDPAVFYDYSGEDTDSYAVAVGSEGEFTAICGYGSAVLCWKERALHKILGNLPSAYQMVTYRFAGVRKGAHKSVVNINEVLLYLGLDGVYSYSGNTPGLISRALGDDVLRGGVGGTDGRLYYLSVENGQAWELLSYDSRTGLWARSDEVHAVDFCRVEDKVKFLAGDTVYTLGGDGAPVEWGATLAPFYETLSGRKQYNRLLLRLQVPLGAYAAADVRFDGGSWVQAGIVNGTLEGTAVLPIPLRRCDRFEVRLRGRGDCAVLELLREFKIRGDR